MIGWDASSKLDGVRAVYSHGVFASRQGNVFYAPAWFSADFPTDKPLDGELWMAPQAFRATVSIVKKQKQTPGEEARWKQLTFRVFDVVEDDVPFSERCAWLRRKLVSKSGRPTTKYARFVPQVTVTSREHLRDLLAVAIDQERQEGLMLRDPASVYEHKRSNSLLKVKPFFDAEAHVLAVERGQGRNAHRMGKLLCEWPNGTQFRVGSGFTDAEREKPPRIGSVITVQYQELDSASGRPRFPTYLRDRSKEVAWEDVRNQQTQAAAADAIGDGDAHVAVATASAGKPAKKKKSKARQQSDSDADEQ